ncbi:type IV secretory system conjugative DNA transfer family protein [Kordiimonas sp. SCSIO 12603]|uniref:type IV secretory system conjugative DNA transfer family protein n=1 Tax=Kordiimonas sp. SCSIO 12603 TaxID=2829596 RepID=UPI002104DFE6|nr:type IV secretory system conjugative DNA transfer family protein [Kordiimonas sp. SCSIO 12603]UTW59530.1 type IV secretory system conjugative DNA transfer family protein [Kordiimonas sp. SCSIO 12603]
MLTRGDKYANSKDEKVLLGAIEHPEKSGNFEALWFGGEGSLVTIAPPGAGKGQAQIIPNLLTYNGSAIVLDIKRENYDLTHEWRRENVGPIYKFAPFDKDTHHYNPLDFIAHKDHAKIWDDAKLMASMIVVQQANPDFWESRAEDMIAAIIAHVKTHSPAKDQNMNEVLDLLWPTKEGLEVLASEMQSSPIDALRRTGNILPTMPEKQRESIFDSARRYAEIWQSEFVRNITDKTEWLPEDFWKPPWKTLYICIPVGRVRTFASVLRVLIGQHIRGLIASAPSRRERELGNIPNALLLIDEMPQLGYMEPIAESIEVGRSYGLSTWMFAQSMGQIRKAYPDADGLMEMCYAQCFMNPEFDTARRLSDRVGNKKSLIAGKRERVVEPQELMGSEYANTILSFVRGKDPMKLDKVFAYEAAGIRERMAQI